MAIPLDNVLVTLLNNLAKLLPFRIVHDYEQAVRFTFGHAGPTIRGKDRGWCLFFPVVQRVESVDATWGQVLLGSLSIETVDKVSLSVSGAIVYKVHDARDYLLSVFDNDSIATLRAITKGCISQVMITETYGAILADTDRVQNRIAERLRQEVDGWGLTVRQVHLHDLIKTRNIRLHGLSEMPQRDIWE